MVFESRVQRSQHAAVGCVVDVAQRQRVAQRVRQGADADLQRAAVAHQRAGVQADRVFRSEEHTSELQSLMRISYSVFCLKKKTETVTSEHMSHSTTQIERRH